MSKNERILFLNLMNDRNADDPRRRIVELIAYRSLEDVAVGVGRNSEGDVIVADATFVPNGLISVGNVLLPVTATKQIKQALRLCCDDPIDTEIFAECEANGWHAPIEHEEQA